MNESKNESGSYLFLSLKTMIITWKLEAYKDK